MAALGEAVNQVMGDLARQVVADGEGARHVYRVEVTGAATAGRGQEGRPDRGPLAPGQDRHGRRRRQLGADHGRPGTLRGPLRPRAGGYRLRAPPRGAKRPGPGSRGRSRGPAGDQVRRLYRDHPPEPRGLMPTTTRPATSPRTTSASTPTTGVDGGYGPGALKIISPGSDQLWTDSGDIGLKEDQWPRLTP